MPTYDYRCPNGHDFELFFRKISEAGSAVPCPQCGAEAVRRVSGGAGLVFKGSGFYLTDYGKNAHRKAGAASSGEGKSGEKSDGKSEGGSDGKTETKPDSSKTEGGTAAPAASGDGATKSATKSEGSKASESKPSSTKSKSGDGQ